MKTYSIGRDLGCDIVINDRTDVVSRRHALINVFPSGKMTIVDQSSNGTYVNGIRVSPNVPVPVTRKDTVSFAHIEKLDWNMVPRSNDWIKYVLVAIAALILLNAVVMGTYFLLTKNKKCDDLPKIEAASPEKAVTDTASNTSVPEQTKDKERQDTVKEEKKSQENPSLDKKNKKKNDDTKPTVKEKEAPSKQSEPKKPARVAG